MAITNFLDFTNPGGTASCLDVGGMQGLLAAIGAEEHEVSDPAGLNYVQGKVRPYDLVIYCCGRTPSGRTPSGRNDGYKPEVANFEGIARRNGVEFHRIEVNALTLVHHQDSLGQRSSSDVGNWLIAIRKLKGCWNRGGRAFVACKRGQSRSVILSCSAALAFEPDPLRLIGMLRILAHPTEHHDARHMDQSDAIEQYGSRARDCLQQEPK